MLFVGGVKPKELLLFYTQMTIIVESGTNIPSGLEALQEQMHDGPLKEVIGDLKQMVQEGQMLSEAMTKHPNLFSPTHVGMIRAGESGGFLPKMLQRIVVLQEQQNELRGILGTALVYPCVLLGVAGVVVLFMLTFILPRFIEIYESTGVTLPLITRILLVFYTMFSSYWFVCLPLFGAAIGAGIWYGLSPSGKALVGNLKMSGPVNGSLRLDFRAVWAAIRPDDVHLDLRDL